MKISPTNFAKSGNCPKKLSSYFKRLDCNIKKNTSLASRDDVASRIGKIVHDLVQEVICSGGKKERDKKKDEIMLVLENMKNDMNLDNNSLSEIIGHNPFENLLHDQGIVRLYEECGPLMEATMKLLSNLEDKFGDMTAIKEFEIKPKGTSRINIAGKEVFLGGFVDLVLLFKKEKKKYAILLELKTGDYLILYTCRGTPSTSVNNDGSTNHFLFWDLDGPIWTKKEDCAVVFEVNFWQTTKFNE